MMKQIILCADDYGQNKAISEGILALLANKRLSAVSCMTSDANWPVHAQWLIPYRGLVDIGLHFNLTEGESALMPLAKLLLRSHLHQLDLHEITSRFDAQLTNFITAMGQFPDFIDGHQHIHQFPQIRDIILQHASTHAQKKVFYCRALKANSWLSFIDGPARLKRLVIEYSGARCFTAQLRKRNIPFNQSFNGVYDFKKFMHFREYFVRFLQGSKSGGLIMCHPGLEGNHPNDPLQQSRPHEYQYFSSPQFLADCQNQNVQLARFGEIKKM